MSALSSDDGQATVELIALLPLLCLLAAALWQITLAGGAVWFANGAARAAARAEAVGGDASAAARGALPARFERGLRVRARDGGVALDVAVPALLGGGTLTTVTARARFEAQR
ncbi:pilus assembly protein [Conexibacter arvalis]|uniref:Pilus assembly protein n=1 Tax=Conexibacter arvalis TaxID=912552 RepID=A0A840IKM7_9ACTN|nr:pilus assembly protein [Conexibacter arvalis]MBB4664488.1 hypothetical protein [Conexibacter arvalis]